MSDDNIEEHEEAGTVANNQITDLIDPIEGQQTETLINDYKVTPVPIAGSDEERTAMIANFAIQIFLTHLKSVDLINIGGNRNYNHNQTLTKPEDVYSGTRLLLLSLASAAVGA